MRNEEQRRTHTLSNGSVIWDFAGNLWEWTNWLLNDSLVQGPTDCFDGFLELSDVSPSTCADTVLLIAQYSPGDMTLSSVNNVGQFRGGVGGGTKRGGDNTDQAEAGIFALNFKNGPTFITDDNGFRCIYRP